LFKNKKKGQISIEVLLILGILVIGGIIVGAFYLSSIHKKTNNINNTDDSTNSLSKWTNKNIEGGTGSGAICGNPHSK